jgi:hypothetical protein
MACQIQINSISGTSPFDIYFCDIGLNQCVFMQTETSPSYPIIIDLPQTLIGVNQLIVKIIDGNGCEIFYPFILPTPTPTPTPTITPSPTPLI